MWDKPQDYGVACKRVDVCQRQSPFNSPRRFFSTLHDVLHSVQATTLVVSLSNEGYIIRTDMEALLAGLFNARAGVSTIENDYERYVGAQIGIYSPKGERVGQVGRLRNKEYLYVVTREQGTRTEGGHFAGTCPGTNPSRAPRGTTTSILSP